MTIRRSLLGILDKRERWGLTPKGWSVLLLVMISGFVVVMTSIYPFLAVTEIADTKTMVVEGWISPLAINSAARLIHSNASEYVFTTGGPVSGTGPYSNDFNTSASVAYTRLMAVGVRTNILRKVPTRIRDRDRTYSAAVALRRWFDKENFHPEAINVVTESVHARRSRLLFEKAFGPTIKVGIISVAPDDYLAKRWWRYSAGVKDVVSEGVAYLYVRLFFWPSAPNHLPETPG